VGGDGGFESAYVADFDGDGVAVQDLTDAGWGAGGDAPGSRRMTDEV
jgi:hypothetical protein